MESLANREFRLIANPDGHATGETIIRFGPNENPYLGTYTGPETVSGQVIAASENDSKLRMIYQSLTSHSKLVAGRADISVMQSGDGAALMVLDWHWLTSVGEGQSEWLEIC